MPRRVRPPASTGGGQVVGFALPADEGVLHERVTLCLDGVPVTSAVASQSVFALGDAWGGLPVPAREQSAFALRIPQGRLLPAHLAASLTLQLRDSQGRCCWRTPWRGLRPFSPSRKVPCRSPLRGPLSGRGGRHAAGRGGRPPGPRATASLATVGQRWARTSRALAGGIHRRRRAPIRHSAARRATDPWRQPAVPDGSGGSRWPAIPSSSEQAPRASPCTA
jgi:hypothetical protein